MPLLFYWDITLYNRNLQATTRLFMHILEAGTSRNVAYYMMYIRRLQPAWCVWSVKIRSPISTHSQSVHNSILCRPSLAEPLLIGPYPKCTPRLHYNGAMRTHAQYMYVHVHRPTCISACTSFPFMTSIQW